MIFQHEGPARLLSQLSLAAFLTSNVALAASTNDTLYNTYANTVGACINDCQAAAEQLCHKDLRSASVVITGQPAVVDQSVTVGACVVRYLNLNPIAGTTTSGQECQTSFQDLMTQTAGSKDDPSCSARLGGISGNDALGRVSSDVVYAYFPKDTPPDGFKPSLNGIPSQGSAIHPNTAFNVDLAPCGGPRSILMNPPNASSDALRKRSACSKEFATAAVIGDILCVISFALAGE